MIILTSPSLHSHSTSDDSCGGLGRIEATSRVGEKQFSNVQKGYRSKEFKIDVYCSWFVGPSCLPYFLQL